MCCLHQLAAMLPLMMFGGPGGIQAEIRLEAPRRVVVVERAGKPPVVVAGSEVILAREDLTGIWQVVLLEHEGEPRPDLAPDLQMKFSRGRLELMQRGRETIIVAYGLDLKYYPRHFHWYLQCDGRLYMQEGVFWVEGDTLMLCLGAVNGRPAAEFLTQPGDGRTLFVLERAKPQQDDRPPSEE
jgi:uncharacterized protein (TIGR03067 family)